MSRLIEQRARWIHGQLQADRPLAYLFDRVMSRDIVVLRDVFPRAQLAQLRNEVHDWGQRVDKQAPQTYIDENFHAIESGISPRQKTPHNYHAYNFNQLPAVDPALSRTLSQVFEP